MPVPLKHILWQPVLFLALFMLYTPVCIAQTQKSIEVEVIDSFANKISGAFVTIENGDHVGIAFGQTDASGKVTLKHPDEAGLFLKIAAPEFKIWLHPLESNLSDIRVILESDIKTLPTVSIKGRRGPRIVSKGDSLFYAVKDFETSADRTIGDILRKLPGIEVSAAGAISFRGRQISKLYIEGDDLLGSRYNLGTNTIKSSMVDSIQVIDNDQHVKVLQGVEEGKSPAINLVLKPEARMIWAHIAEWEAGLPDKLSAGVTSMAFKPKFKTLNILNGEKTGKDLIREMATLAPASLSPWAGLDFQQDVLYNNQIVFANLPDSRWLFNKGGTATTNNLIRLTPDHSLNINGGYTWQQDDETFREQMTYYLPQDTIHLTNKKTNLNTSQRFFATISNTANNKKSYLTNELTMNGAPVRNDGSTDENGQIYHISQSFNSFGLSNNFKNIRVAGNRFITELTSFISIAKGPERMEITPGVIPETLNNHDAYETARQNITLNKINTSNAFGIRLNGEYLYQQYNAGFSFLRQKLETNLAVVNHNHTIENEINGHGVFSMFSPFLYGKWELRFSRRSLGIELLSSFPMLQFRDDAPSGNLHKNLFQANPSFNYESKIGKENKLTVNAALRNSHQDIYTLYRAPVLKDYRTLSSQNIPLDNTRTFSAGFRFDFQKSLKIFFANFGMRYNQTNNHFIFQDSIAERLLITRAIPFENKISGYSWFAGITKYFFSIGATLELAYNGSTHSGTRLQNNNSFPVKNLQNTWRGRVQRKFGKVLEADYRITYSDALAKINPAGHAFSHRYYQWQHVFSLNATPTKNWLFNTSLQQQKFVQSATLSSFFWDAKVRYTIEKLRLDINLGVYNISNKKSFGIFSFSENILYESTIELRPRTVYVSTYFTF